MRSNYCGYRPSKTDKRLTIIGNLEFEYAEYLGNMNLKQLKLIAESNSFELKARKALTEV